MPTWPPVMVGKNDDNKLHQDNLSCKWTGHLGGHIAIFHVCFGGCLAGCLGGHLRGYIYIYIYVTGCRPSASAHTLRDSGELHSSTERDSSFPCSTPGVVPSVPICIQELISLSQPVYRQAGDYK